MSKKKTEPPHFAATVESFCRMIDTAQKDYANSASEMEKLDKLTQDYLHKLELGDLDYKERAKLATKLRDCRQARRGYKDTIEVLEPLVQFVESERGHNMMNLMHEVLGKTRKVEERMATRIYWPRVMGGGVIKK